MGSSTQTEYFLPFYQQIMTERTRLLTSPTEAEILNFPADREPPSAPHYGSIESPPPPQDNQPPDEPMDDSKTTLKFFEKIGFSLGHIYNDLCAGVWFSYTLLFMQNVLQMPSYQAGALVMLGQVGDAIATPIVGMLTDKYSTKRKWHVFGEFLAPHDDESNLHKNNFIIQEHSSCFSPFRSFLPFALSAT